MFEWLRDNDFLIRQRGEAFNSPTQRSMEQGLFEIKKRTINNPDGSIRTTRTPKVLARGKFILLKSSYKKPRWHQLFKITTRIEFPGANAHSVIDVETHADDLYMVRLEQYEHQADEGSERSLCTEQLCTRDDLRRLRSSINHILGYRTC